MVPGIDISVLTKKATALPEQHFPQVGLQQELLRDPQRLEHQLNVTIRQRTLAGPRGRIRPMLQHGRVDHDVPS